MNLKKNLLKYMQSNQFRIMKNIIMILLIVSIACICFLSGLFFKRKHNITYDKTIFAETKSTQTTMTNIVTTTPTEITKATTPAITEVTIPMVSAGFIIEDIQNMDISEFISEYNYSTSGKFENKKTYQGYNVPFTKKSFTLSFDGIIIAQIDTNAIDVRVDEFTKTIYVNIPYPKITSNEADKNSIKINSENSNLFNPIEDDDYQDYINQQKQEMEEKANQNGVLENLYQNTRKTLQKLLLEDEAVKNYYSLIFNDNTASKSSIEKVTVVPEYF